MNMQREDQYYLGLNVCLLQIFGFWHKKTGGTSWRLIFYTFCILIFFIGSVSQIVRSWKDLALFTDALDILLIVTLTAHKAYGIHSNQDYYRLLIQTVQKNFYLPVAHEIRDRKEKQGRTLTITFLTFASVVAATLVVYPLIDRLFSSSKESPWKLPFRTSFPVDTQRPEIYGILYFYHFIIASSHAFLIPSHDNFIISLILHAQGQFQILNINLENFLQQALKTNMVNLKRFREIPLLADNEKLKIREERNVQAENLLKGRTMDFQLSQEEYNEELKAAVYQNLRSCVKHHLTLIRYVECLESLVNKVLLNQLISSCLIFCTTAFLMTTMPIEKSLSVMPLMGGAMFQLWMYCYFGHELKLQSELVSTAAYFSLWYEAPAEAKTYVKMIMMRGNHKPAVLSIGKFAELSLNTFSSALRASYTYFTLLNEVHDA